MSKTIATAVLIGCSLLTTACTNRTVYDTLRGNERLECNRLPNGSERDECLQRTTEDYDSYKRKRDEALKQ
ncbi:MAG TPA: hypothetical protein VJS66_00640 [Burkholderiales bacterium]|nr:hypothetical protein [Burkholderiales bacterium]